jgi:hypothetical protein
VLVSLFPNLLTDPEHVFYEDHLRGDEPDNRYRQVSIQNEYCPGVCAQYGRPYPTRVRFLRQRFSRKERFKNARPHVCRYTLAVISNFHQNISWLAFRTHFQLSTFGHGIYSINDQTGPNLIELAAVGLDVRQIVVVVTRHLDVFLFQFELQDEQRTLQPLMQVDFLDPTPGPCNYILLLRPQGRRCVQCRP